MIFRFFYQILVVALPLACRTHLALTACARWAGLNFNIYTHFKLSDKPYNLMCTLYFCPPGPLIHNFCKKMDTDTWIQNNFNSKREMCFFRKITVIHWPKARPPSCIHMGCVGYIFLNYWCMHATHESSQLCNGRLENLNAESANIPKLIVRNARVCFPSSNLMS